MADPRIGPEAQLAAACCRPPGTPGRADAIRAAAAGGVDWAQALRLVQRHRVDALVLDGLAQAGLDAPAEFRETLAARAAAIGRTSLVHAAEAVRLNASFEAARIPVLFLKGETLALLAYGKLGLKASRDVDLLVRPQDADRAAAALGEAGYVQIEPPPDLPAEEAARYRQIEKETVWRNPRSGIVVDLHYRPVNNASLIPAIGMNSPVRQVRIAEGRTLPTLAEPELFAYLAAHGALAGWTRMKWIADVAAFLAGRSEEEVAALYRAAVRHGAGRCAGQALLLCRRLFAMPLPATLRRRLEGNRLLAWLEQVALEAMLGGDAAADLTERRDAARTMLLSHLLLGTGWRYRGEVLRERWSGAGEAPSPSARLAMLARVARDALRLRRGASPGRRPEP